MRRVAFEMGIEGERFFEIAASGRANTAAEWQAYLVEFHDEFPRANELFALMKCYSGETSYGVLARAVAATGAQRVLDLGCGDGNLLEELLDTGPAAARFTGIDISASEIAIARSRLGGNERLAVDLGDVRALPYESDSFDCVVSHQVLNLFPEISPTLDEVARVLRPGGDLLIAANRGWRNDRGANWILLSQAAVAAIERRSPRFVWPKMGDMRIYDEGGIPEIFAESKRWDLSSLSLALTNTRAFMAPERIAAIYNRLYVFGTAPNKAEILEAVEARARELAVGGLVEVDIPFRLIHIKKQPDREKV